MKKNNGFLIGSVASLFTIFGIGMGTMMLSNMKDVKDDYKPYDYNDDKNDDYDYHADIVAVIIDGTTAKIVSMDEMVVGRIDEESDNLVLYTQDGDVITTDTNQISIYPETSFDEAWMNACELVGEDNVYDMIHKEEDSIIVSK
jgi:hypothetical protein